MKLQRISLASCLVCLAVAVNSFANDLNFPSSTENKGKALYQTHCAACHEGGNQGQAPSRIVLSIASARSIVTALESGRMASFGKDLTATQKIDIAQYITNQQLVNIDYPKSAYCTIDTTRASAPIYWNGWGANLLGNGYQDQKNAGFSQFDVTNLSLKWAFAFPGTAQMRTVPVVVGDQLVVAGGDGEILSLNRHRGCIQWRTKLKYPVRGGVVMGDSPSNSQIVFTGDNRTNTYAFDLRTGEQLWRTQIGIHPESSITGAPAIYKDTLFVPLSSGEAIASANPLYPCCTSSGELVALDTRSGKIKWRYKTIDETPVQIGHNNKGTARYAPSGAPIWSAPTVDPSRNTVYIGVGQNYTRPTTSTSDSIIALDIDTGQPHWIFQATKNDAWNVDCYNKIDPSNCPTKVGPDFDFGMSPIVYHDHGFELLLVGQKSGTVWALNPDDGAVVWQTRVGKGTVRGGIHWGMSADSKRVYVPIGDHGQIMQDLAPQTPRSPGLYALDVRNGKFLWKQPFPSDACHHKSNCVAANSAAISSIAGVVFAPGLDGVVRAHASDTGELIWQYDTDRQFDTINGIAGFGGAIDSVRPIIAGGMMYLNSGYGFSDQKPGNVLLAFQPTQ